MKRAYARRLSSYPFNPQSPERPMSARIRSLCTAVLARAAVSPSRLPPATADNERRYGTLPADGDGWGSQVRL